jgi:signal transduction histidine kinase
MITKKLGPGFLGNTPSPFILSDYDGNIIFLNTAAKADFGRAKNISEIAGTTLSDILGSAKLLLNKKVKRKSGEKTYRFSISKDPTSKTISALGLDVTGASTSKLILAKKYSELKSIDKAKTDFLSISSHELRSPLTPMKAQLQMLLNGYFGKMTGAQSTSIRVILKNADRLDLIIQNLLEISRIEANRITLNLVDTDLQPELAQLRTEMTQLMMDKRVNIFLKTEKLPLITVDAEKIIQILRILVHNAIKFSPHLGDVTILADVKAGETVFSVKDSGIGISKENQKRIFQPFFQAEKTIYRKYGGLGLGLAIARGLVRACGGKIWFTSAIGKGTTFFFTVPREPPKIVKPVTLM